MLAIDGTYRAYCLDQAVMTFGRALENAIDDVVQSTKSKKMVPGKVMNTIAQWTGRPKKFRSPGTT